MRFRTVLIALVLAGGGMTASKAGPAIKGDVAKGEALMAERCAACHGPDGNSPVPSFPKLAGQHAEYLLHELNEYKEHHRDNEMMLPIVESLNQEDMVNLAVFLAAQKPAPGTVTEPALLARGKKVYLEGNPDTGVPSCDGCHEEDGAGSSRFPRIAGQNVEYTLEQFRLYTAGKRPYAKKVMRTVAERLTEHEARAVAEYLASLP
ncbi:MAG: c-type cytochrome [Gallionellaceae bacterium]|nr:c-type cytochrome [Gallionellaceae bacterium]MDD5366552.1 c-type cytochrome [Gallionellaceae bacterium]